jgi:hypothetical protein
MMRWCGRARGPPRAAPGIGNGVWSASTAAPWTLPTQRRPSTSSGAAAFGRPGSRRGASADPQIRFVALIENGTHVLFATHMAGCATGETTLAPDVLAGLQRGMLCLADRQFFGFALWRQAHGTGAELLWRIKKNIRLPCAKRLLSLSKGRRLLPEPSLWL